MKQRPHLGGTGTVRTVAVTATATGTLDIEIECEADHHATTTATAQFRADDEAACSTDLGVLWHGSIARTGTLSATSCVSDKRTPSSGTFHAHRYTFTMATAGWVSIDLEGAGEGPEKLDTYLVVLYGHGSGGVERIRDDDSGGDGDARAADVLLAAGRYTIEATTTSNGAKGTYRLRVQGDFDVRAPDQPVRPRATVGQQIARTWAHQPPTAKVTLQSVAPDGLDASIVSDDGLATLTASPARPGDYTVTVAYTASGHTSTRTTIIDADCPPRHIETQTRTCTPRATALPAGCTPTALHDGRIWGRRKESGTFDRYAGSAPAACTSLTQSDKAAYYRFTLPDRLPVKLKLEAGNGGPRYLATAGGAPSMTIWRVLGTHPATGQMLSFEATSASARRHEPSLQRTLRAGTYLIELAPSTTVTTQGQFALTTELPTAQRAHADVQNVGNTGLGGAGMTLGRFLDARGSLIYGAHPDADPTRATDPFYPESADYPWLPFTTDRCSIPPGWILHLAENATDEAAIRLGPLGWFAAHFLLPDADEIDDHPQFGGETVPFVYGCMRHDFNWRNLHRVKHHYRYDTATGTWNNTVRGDADTRLGTDLKALCNANWDDAPETSRHYKWELPNDAAIGRCERAAAAVESALGAVPFSWIGYDHD